MILSYKTNDSPKQCAVGVSFDFDRFIDIINQKTSRTSFRNELAICSLISLPISESNKPTALKQANSNNSSSNKSLSQQINKSQTSLLLQNEPVDHSLLTLLEIRNKLRLYKQFLDLNRNLNISTYIAHEKFESLDDADEYFKSCLTNSYAYLKENSAFNANQIFLLNNPITGATISPGSLKQLDQTSFHGSNSQLSNENMVSGNLSISPTSTSFFMKENILRLRSLVGKCTKFFEEKLDLNDFLVKTNSVVNSINGINSYVNPLPNLISIGNQINLPNFMFTLSGMQSKLKFYIISYSFKSYIVYIYVSICIFFY